MHGKYEVEESIKHQINFQDLMASSHTWIKDTVLFNFVFRQPFCFPNQRSKYKVTQNNAQQLVWFNSPQSSE